MSFIKYMVYNTDLREPTKELSHLNEYVYIARAVDARMADFTNEVEILNDICERKEDRLNKFEMAMKEALAELDEDCPALAEDILRKALGL